MLPILCSLFAIHYTYLASANDSIAGNLPDASKFIIWGAGLTNPRFALPVRYFYLQLVDRHGLNITAPPEPDYIKFTTDGSSNCRIGRQVIDRLDGSYILRFRLYNTCEFIRLSISTKNGKSVAKSPYKLQGSPYLYPESCDCPQPISDWLTAMGCPTSYRQLKRDLSSWEKNSVNFTHALEQVLTRYAAYPGSHSVCHYQIINNQVYRHCYGQHVGFNMFSDEIFLSLTRKVLLPNMEFFMNLGDWPLEKRKISENPVPIISWCGSQDTRDLVIPTYEITQATLEMMGRQTLDIQSVQSMTGPKWSEKINKAFWRGRDSRQERLDLVELARKNPDILEAGITRFFFFRDQMTRYGPEVPHLPFGDFFKYKYQINLDGTVSAYRLGYLLAGDALVLKQDSSYYEHFYDELEPWVHYVPFKRDLSDVVDRIQWAMTNEAQVLKVIENARSFIGERLQPKDIFCYHVIALKEYANILNAAPSTPRERMEHVTQPSESKECLCDGAIRTPKSEL